MIQHRQIENAVFYGSISGWAAFRDLQLAAIQSGNALEAVLHEDHVSLGVVAASTSSGITLSGTWSSPDFERFDPDTVGVKLSLPFLFRTSAINLPTQQIHTFGKAHRTIADFFLRNLFYDVCRDAPVAFRIRKSKSTVQENIRNLQRQYFYLIKSQFPEPELTNRPTNEALTFLTASAYLPVLDLKNPLLQQAGRELRAQHNMRTASDPIPEMLARLKATQAEIRTYF